MTTLMMTTLERPVGGSTWALRTFAHLQFDDVIASLTKPTPEEAAACEVCAGIARYEGRGCADDHWVKLCDRCLNMAIGKLNRMRDETKLLTGSEPVCNRCWRPMLEPATHIIVRPQCQ